MILNLTSPWGGENNWNVSSAVLWGASHLSDTQHTLVMSMAPGGGYVEVDAFMYEPPSTATSVSHNEILCVQLHNFGGRGPVEHRFSM